MALPHRSSRITASVLGIGTALAINSCTSKPVTRPIQAVGASCPQWTTFPADHHSNADSQYLGCVSAANLRAMVADPADLERGRQLGPASGERETRAIEVYTQGKLKPFEGGGASGAAVSTSGSGSGGTP
jgi:type IV pilus biogenesis protein CpaD/CtpE